VLDTWFSSGLWPFSTLGWPEQTPDLKYFYPTSYMETGYDILFFWVARMIMSGLEFTGEVPFHTVYLHGLVRDEHGQKMSKTKGNVIDPLIVMDQFGTDALRFTLLVGSTPGNDMNLSVKKVEANRNFANKLWNAGRFVISAIAALDDGQRTTDDGLSEYTLADSWIWARLQNLIRDVERQFQNFQYGQAGQQIYDFIWSDFADWYVEIAKEQMKNEATKAQTVETLARVWDISLRLLHPFTPFVTEEIWGHLHSALRESPISHVAKDWPHALIVAKFPEPREPEGWEAEKIAEFESVIDGPTRAIRNLFAEKKIKGSRKYGVTYVDSIKTPSFKDNLPIISALSSTDFSQSAVYETYKPTEELTPLIVGSTEMYINLSINENSEEDKPRLEKELKEAESHIQRLETLLNSDFANKAPAALIQKERDKLAGYKETAEKIKAQLK
jgi:valyl-tRNA synthetase